MKTFVPFLFILLAVAGCGDRIDGRLIFTEPAPEKGFEFPYYLYLPDGVSPEREMALVVEPNNSGFVSDDLAEHVEKAGRTACRDYYIGNYVASNLGHPLLVPVFPRPESDWRIYTHALDRDVVLQKGTLLERIDLQLLSMVDHAAGRLKEMGYRLRPGFLLTGFSASGTFANRFAMVHPDRVLAVAAGGLNGLIMLPCDSLDGRALPYPVGTADFEELFEKPFDSLLFRSLPQFYFMGALDDNDAIPYADGYEDQERELIYQVLDSVMMPGRWNRCIDIYSRNNINARFMTYDQVGHEHPEPVKEDILGFFREMLQNP